MGRAPLPLGDWGAIRTYAATHDEKGRPTGYRAVTTYRRFDGSTTQVERRGRSKTAAVSNLKEALRTLANQGHGGELTASDRFSTALGLWFDRLDRLVVDGERSASTVDTYRRVVSKHVAPALGKLTLGELSTPLVDRFISSVKATVGAPTAKTCRSVVSGVMGMAVRYGAVVANPVRDVDTVTVKPKKQPRALTDDERVSLLARLRANEAAVRQDLPAITTFMLATGVRVGEALAVLWSEVDLDTGRVDITSTIIRVKGVGLVRKGTKSRAGQRSLLLPSWALATVRERAEDGYEPDGPLFPNNRGTGFRDPSNVLNAFRAARGTGDLSWVTSHTFRKTMATFLDDAGFSPRMMADQLGHERPSMTQDVYLARNTVNPRIAAALEDGYASQIEK